MKKHYLSAKRLSLWIRTVNKWKNLRNSFKGIWSTSQWKKFNNLNSILGIKRKVALATLAGGMAFNAQAQDNFIEITNRDDQFLKTRIKNVYNPCVADLDGDNDLDFVAYNHDTDKLVSYSNDSGTFNRISEENDPFSDLEFDLSDKGAPFLEDLDNDGDLDLIVGTDTGTVQFYENIDDVYVHQTGTENPFNSIDIETGIYPTLADTDSDGDLDLVFGSNLGAFQYYKNENSVFTEQTGDDNPFTFNLGSRSFPRFYDIDGDNDLDLISGGDNRSTRVYYFNNEDGVYTTVTNSEGPFSDVTLRSGTSRTTPNLIDLDNDGDLDLITGERFGDNIYSFFNEEGKYISTENNPFAGISTTNKESNGSLVDVDNDGDLDLVAGDYDGTISHFENNNNVFTLLGYDESPLRGEIDTRFRSRISFGDLDNDGDLDLVMSDYGRIDYYINNDSAFVEQEIEDNPFYDLSIGGYASPTLVDIDDDGDLDLFSGNYSGNVILFINDEGVYTKQEGDDDPFGGVDLGSRSFPSAMDVDGDKDLDLVVGAEDGKIYYFENEDGDFTQRMGEDNPFDHIDIGSFSTPTFADTDNDTDLDLLVGSLNGVFYEFENTTILTGLFSSSEVETLNIYPNPTSSIINTEKGALEILDLTGNSVLRTESTGQVDVSVLQSGIYIVTQNGKRTKMIIE